MMLCYLLTMLPIFNLKLNNMNFKLRRFVNVMLMNKLFNGPKKK